VVSYSKKGDFILNNHSIIWSIGTVLIISIFLLIGFTYTKSNNKDNLSKSLSAFYSPSIFTLVVSLRTLSISDFSKSNRPLELILESLYFLFVISIILNLLNILLIEANLSMSSIKKGLFYIVLFFNSLAVTLWMVVAYMLFEIL
jgi:hypothetical protein